LNELPLEGVVASGEPGSGGVDALSASYLAGVLAQRGGAPVPVLLTRQAQLPQADVDAITTLTSSGPARTSATIYVIGGPAAVSDTVLTALHQVGGGPVTRVSGADRYATAAATATAQGAAAVGAYAPNPTDGAGATVFLSNGLSPADALSAGPIAYRSRFPLLLTQQGSIPRATVQAMKTDEVRNVILLGGTTAVSDIVVTALQGAGYSVVRVAGADRYATNTALYTFAHTADGSTAATPGGGSATPHPPPRCWPTVSASPTPSPPAPSPQKEHSPPPQTGRSPPTPRCCSPHPSPCPPPPGPTCRATGNTSPPSPASDRPRPCPRQCWPRPAKAVR